MGEAHRQQALLCALAGVGDAGSTGLRERGERAARGLEAYRANAEVGAERALAAAFPVVKAMVGPDDFSHLAREFWQASPPSRGDLGEWGDAFPAWLASHAAMAPWPCLGDCARLDIACHRSERAADAVLDMASLSLLESRAPSSLRLQLMPGTALIRSGWPIVAIHRAHQLDGDAAERAFALVREAIAEHQGEDALVGRQGWRAVVHALSDTEARWTQTLLDGADLDSALIRAGEDFDFAAWLQRAVDGSWLQAVVASD
jgi:hypothetical protein